MTTGAPQIGRLHRLCGACRMAKEERAELSTEPTEPLMPSLGMSVSPDCQLRCLYCPPGGEDIDRCRGVCSFDIVRATMVAARAAGLFFVRLTGGEPLTRPDRCRQALGASIELGFERIVLDTNGVALRENIKWLADFAPRFECKVSLDALDRGVYRRITGTDAALEVASAIRCATESGLRVTVNIVVSRLNLESFWPVLDLCEEVGAATKLFDVFDFCGHTRFPWSKLHVGLEEVVAALERRYESLERVRLPGNRGLAMRKFKMENGRELLVVQHHGSGAGTRAFSEICRDCSHYPCAVGRFQLVLRSDGMLLPCRLRADLAVPTVGSSAAQVRDVVSSFVVELKSHWFE